MKNKNVGATGNGATFVLQTHEGIVKGFCLAISGHEEYVIIAKRGHFIWDMVLLPYWVMEGCHGRQTQDITQLVVGIYDERR